jgi:hypothetical protein
LIEETWNCRREEYFPDLKSQEMSPSMSAVKPLVLSIFTGANWGLCDTPPGPPTKPAEVFSAHVYKKNFKNSPPYGGGGSSKKSHLHCELNHMQNLQTLGHSILGETQGEREKKRNNLFTRIFVFTS